MNPEKEIVNIWLNKNGFFTINDINAGKRVVDIVALRHGEVRHVEVNCSLSSRLITTRDAAEITEQFNNPNVIKTVQQAIRGQAGETSKYDKVLITTDSISLDGIEVINFSTVLAEVMRDLDKQYYKNSVVRTMQLLKYLFMSEATSLTPLLVNEDKHKALTYLEKEKMVLEILSQPSSQKLFRKKENEAALIRLLMQSTLSQPERLAAALEQILSKRSVSRFMNVLLQQKNIQTAIKEELARDQKLERFFK